MIRFLIDAQLPPALVQYVAETGHQAEHVASRLGPGASDRAIFELAEREALVIMTKDADFLGFPFVSGRLVWLRTRNLSNRALREWLDARWGRLLALLTQEHRRIEVV